ncbi:MAG: DUF6520 family protein [Algibacter sp.]
MKRNFLKNSLRVFAFTLAIVSSFAFSVDKSDDFLPNQYVQLGNIFNPYCLEIPPACDLVGPKYCTAFVLGNTHYVHGSINESLTVCIGFLYDTNGID